MKDKTLGFIGGGRITRIMLNAFVRAKEKFKDIVVFDIDKEMFPKLKNINSSVKTGADFMDSAAKCDIVILSVHPPVLKEMFPKIRLHLKKESIVISLAPKITLENIQSELNDHQAVVRANPSAPAMLNCGITPVSFAETVNNSQKKIVTEMFKTLGKVPVVEEKKLEAYAMISAMGPTYFWFQLHKLKELGIKFGMDEDEAQKVIADMVTGTARILFESGLSHLEVMDLVPVKPLSDYEKTIKGYYDEKLNTIFDKIKT